MAGTQQRHSGSLSLKPNKSECYDGSSGFVIVSNCLYTVHQYLSLDMLSKQTACLSGKIKIIFAASFFTSDAASWWYTIIQLGQVPTTWDKFKTLVMREFIPSDHIRKTRRKLRRLKRTDSISKFLAEFQNCNLTITDMLEEENSDQFASGLKGDVRINGLKTEGSILEEDARIALRIYVAIHSYRKYITCNIST